MPAEVSLDGRTLSVLRTFKGYRDDRSTRRMLASDEYGRQRSVLQMSDTEAARRMLARATDSASLLEDDSTFARFETSGSGSVDDKDAQLWLEEWVRGVRLRDLLRAKPRRFLLSDAQQLAIDLASVLSSLRAHGVEHGNISPETLILAEPSIGAIAPRYRFRLVNMSQSRRLSDNETQTDDRAILEILAEVHNTLFQRRDAPWEARRYLLRLQEFLIRAGGEIDRGRPLSPEALRELGSVGIKASPVERQTRNTLVDPFDFISAEHFSNDAVLHRVFANSCPWIEEAIRPSPTLIEGPRGCGKSMVLRWLSVKTQLASPTPIETMADMEVAGFYVACAAEVQTRVSRFANLEDASNARRELVHYLNMVLLYEVSTTLVAMARHDVPEWGLGDDAATAIYEYIAAEVKAGSVPAAGVALWDQVRDLAHAQLDLAHGALEGEPIDSRLTIGSFLHDLARTLTEQISFFSDKRIAYCLDDYSTHRIPEAVQQVFNEVVFAVRSGNHVFKISAENRGFYPYGLNGSRIEVQREMTQIDFGSAYIEATDSDRRRAKEFARDLLANRLAAAEWAGSPEQILGETHISHAEFTRLARARKPAYYAGLDCITDLCTGDVANLLLVYKNIFIKAGVTASQTTQVSPKKQDEAIRETSRFLLELVRAHVPSGMQMIRFVDGFCELARVAMMDGSEITEHGRKEPRKQTRIEVDDFVIPEPGQEDSDSDRFFIQLLRRSILVELKPGVSRRGVERAGPNARTSVRLAMRRMYLPAYGLTLSKNLSWNLSGANFRRMLEQPNQFFIEQRQSVLRGAQNSRADADMETLPGLEVE